MSCFHEVCLHLSLSLSLSVSMSVSIISICLYLCLSNSVPSLSHSHSTPNSPTSWVYWGIPKREALYLPWPWLCYIQESSLHSTQTWRSGAWIPLVVLGRDHIGGDKLTRSVAWGVANSMYYFCCFYKLMCCLLVHSGCINAQGDYPNLERTAGKEMLLGLWD